MSGLNVCPAQTIEPVATPLRGLLYGLTYTAAIERHAVLTASCLLPVSVHYLRLHKAMQWQNSSPY